MRRRAAVAMACVGLAVASAAPGAPAHTTETGRGPTIVLIHSMGVSGDAWTPIVGKLGAHQRVVIADLPGHGQTPLPDPFSLGAAADAVGEMLAAQKDKNTVVVGQGMGGVLALLALAAHPGSARGLVLIDASLKSPTPADSSQRASITQMIDQNFDSISRSLFTRLGRDSAQGAAIRAQAARLPPATIKAYLVEMMLMDVTPTLEAAHLPILAIGTERVWTADKDSLAFVKQMGYDAAPGIEVRRMADCGFMVASEKPDALVALLDDFAAKVRARR